jgi:hypothetical protein
MAGKLGEIQAQCHKRGNHQRYRKNREDGGNRHMRADQQTADYRTQHGADSPDAECPAHTGASNLRWI